MYIHMQNNTSSCFMNVRAFLWKSELLISCLSFVEVFHSVTWGEGVILHATNISPGHWYICRHQHACAQNERTQNKFYLYLHGLFFILFHLKSSGTKVRAVSIVKLNSEIKHVTTFMTCYYFDLLIFKLLNDCARIQAFIQYLTK